MALEVSDRARWDGPPHCLSREEINLSRMPSRGLPLPLRDHLLEGTVRVEIGEADVRIHGPCGLWDNTPTPLVWGKMQGRGCQQ